MNEKKEFLIISDNRTIYKIPIAEIIYVHSKGMRSTIHTSCGAQYSCSKNLGSLCKDIVKSNVIYRIHTSYAVNLKEILCAKKEKSGFVLMKNGHAIPISKRKKSTFFKTYLK